MKKLIITILTLVLFYPVFGQYVILTPPDKAVVYFVNTEKVFKGGYGIPIYDNKDIICRMVGGTFFRFECDPGEHLFWLNTALEISYNMKQVTFCEANLQAGKIYLVIVKTKWGQGSNIYPIDPSNDWVSVEKIRSTLTNKFSKELSSDTEVKKMKKKPKFYDNALTTILEEYYPRHKAKNKVSVLPPEWYVTREELMYGKKKADSEL